MRMQCAVASLTGIEDYPKGMNYGDVMEKIHAWGVDGFCRSKGVKGVRRLIGEESASITK